MTSPLKALTQELKGYLHTEQGFSLKANRFTREDALLRSVWLMPGRHAKVGDYNFDIVMDVGIPGLSRFTSRAQHWVVRASAQKVYLHLQPTGRTFLLAGSSEDVEVEESALDTARYLCERFVLKYSSPIEFYQMVRDNAVEFKDDPSAINEFKELELSPWNAVARLELATMYGAYLKQPDWEALMNSCIEYAGANRMDYVIPRIRSSVEAVLNGVSPDQVY